MAVGVEGEAGRAVTMAKSKAKQPPRPAPRFHASRARRRRWKPCRETSRGSRARQRRRGLPRPPSVLS